ncbi:MAG: RidA family protein [Halanaerobiales bacterium]|nr:RidA family protein [Halanaerobiales bacterium]
MIERIVIPPNDQYDLSTFTITDDLVQIGHIGGTVNEKGEVLKTIEEQMDQTLNNLEEALKEIDLNLDNVLKLTVILKGIEDFAGMHSIWVKHFKEGKYPVRAVITSEFVSNNCLVQVEGTAAYN